MSAIGGIFSRSGAPVLAESLSSLSRSLRQSGPDGEAAWLSGALGMIHRPFHTDHRSLLAPAQPLVADGYALAWDGRLDNAEELASCLDGGKDLSEPELVLAAFRSWGLEATGRLDGDFAFSLWSPRERALILGRDPFGIRPLYVHENAEQVIWASTIGALLDAGNLPLDVDDEFVANFLTRFSTPGSSPLKAVQAVPAGHVLVFQDARRYAHRYWSLDPRKEIVYGSDEEYEEHFRHLFRRAMACRLRSNGPVFCQLSGGLDSSSLVCVGDELLASAEAEAPDLLTASYVFGRSFTSDERPFIRKVEEHRGRCGLHIDEDRQRILALPPDTFLPDRPSFQLCYLARQDFLAEKMREAGSRVLLSGVAGDQVLCGEVGTPHELADHLSRGRMPELLRACHAWAHALSLPHHKVFWEGAVWPLLPRPLRARINPVFPLEGLFERSFIRRLGLYERLLGPRDDSGFPLPSSREQRSSISEVVFESESHFHLSEGCIETRFPFLDRRLVEFLMAIPLAQKLRPGQTRSLLRRALRGTLPEAVRKRRSKAGPHEAIYRALTREWPGISALFQDPLVCRLGYVNRESLKLTLQKVRHGAKVTSPQLIRTICLEIWLHSLARRHERSRGAASSNLPPARRQHLAKGESHDRDVRVA
jgi:asparagine synthase (glutamine-hydrolysing)